MFVFFSTVQALRPLGNASAAVCSVTGYRNPGDGGGGSFYWDEQCALPDDDGTIVGTGTKGRWRRIFTGAIDTRWFGSVGDGVVDDAAAIQNAINAAITQRVGVYVPPGTHRISKTLVVAGDLVLRGAGQHVTQLVADPGITAVDVQCANAGRCVDIGFFMLKGGAIQLLLSGQNTGNLLRDSSVHDLYFALYTACGLKIDTGVIGTAHRNLNFEGGAAGPANAGIYCKGESYMHYSSWYNVRCTTNTSDAVHIEDTTVGNQGAGTLGVAFHQLTLEGNHGSGIYLKGAGLILYNPYFERNADVAGHDIELDTNYLGSSVTRSYVKLVYPAFDVPSAAQLDGSGYTRIKFLNSFVDLVIDDAHLAAGYQHQIDVSGLNSTVALTRSAIQVIRPYG